MGGAIRSGLQPVPATVAVTITAAMSSAGWRMRGRYLRRGAWPLQPSARAPVPAHDRDARHGRVLPVVVEAAARLSPEVPGQHHATQERRGRGAAPPGLVPPEGGPGGDGVP